MKWVTNKVGIMPITEVVKTTVKIFFEIKEVKNSKMPMLSSFKYELKHFKNIVVFALIFFKESHLH